MAKVGTEHYFFGRDRSAMSHEYDICYSKKLGFYAKVHKDIVTLSPQIEKVVGKTYEEAVSNYKKHVDTIYEKGIIQKKVIVYYAGWRFPKKYSAENVNKDPWEGWEDHNESKFVHTCQESMVRLTFQYYVMNMVEMGGNLYITDNYINDLSVMPARFYRWKWNKGYGYGIHEWSSWEYMDHTDAAEEWFKKTHETFSKLVSSVASFFGTDTDQLLLNMKESAFKQLLLNTTNDTNK